jgi:hypothetical protein
MTIEEIRAAIQASPELLAMAQAEVPDEAAIAAALPPIIALREVFVTERGVVATLGLLDGEAFLTALGGFASPENELPEEHPLLPYKSGIARQLAWLKKDGIDVGSGPARDLLDALVAAGIVQAQHASAIKAMAEEAIPVDRLTVRRAIFNPDGSRAV